MCGSVLTSIDEQSPQISLVYDSFGVDALHDHSFFSREG